MIKFLNLNKIKELKFEWNLNELHKEKPYPKGFRFKKCKWN